MFNFLLAETKSDCKLLKFNVVLFSNRLNTLVEQEVKRRLYEERVLREKQRSRERAKDLEERQHEMAKLKRAHERELKRLKEKFLTRLLSSLFLFELQNMYLLYGR